MALRDNLSEWSKTPFESTAHMMEAMRDKQYSDPRNSAYRKAVEAKVLLGSNGTRTAIHNSVEREDAAPGAGIGNGASVAAAERKEHDAERDLYESRGPMSVSPAARARIQRENDDPNSGYGFQSSEG